MGTSTSDLCDRHAATIAQGGASVLPGEWVWFGSLRSCQGEVVTIKAEGCNGEIRELLSQPGKGRVLVIDAGQNPLALLGDNLAALARRNGWEGVVINGNVRDVERLAQVALGILAISCWPVRSNNENGSIVQEALNIRGTDVFPGDWLYADEDGVLVSRLELHSQAPATEATHTPPIC